MPALTATVLLIDDDLATVKDVHSVLAQEGYRVGHMVPGTPAIRQVLKDEPDLVILGINGPEREWEFCRQLVTFLDEPLFLLLSSGDELDRAKGLELGADDCMMKPLLMVEFLARVRALLRRSLAEDTRLQRSLFVDGDLRVNLTNREVRVSGVPVALTAKQFGVLCCLIRHCEEVVPYETLLLEVWGPDRSVSRPILKQYIHQLRRRLEPDPERPQRIVTWRGEGYALRRLAPSD